MDGYDYSMIIISAGVALRIVSSSLFDFLAWKRNCQKESSNTEQKSLSESEQKLDRNTRDHF
ncbi:MAG: hypothetical protein KKE62_01830 [Proteobacteria bacterium]|nr:hypothetical protein [Pseudomonadota bacterium]MBU1387122.1 hypothetical protein [Pseudomonadota bacterium]MBU1541561.1 hypothetical protein [Pseudomonadota bacterium]MBU2429086.1 hypothetical protein [Pseudomonadota bacterium]MBU2482769.1 hypothetical protein [Pseudomonadota bacterium]